MPNLDGGHYFLTALIPVKTGLMDDTERNYTSHVHALRSYLARLPTALQSRANEERARKAPGKDGNSPFARNRHTHFARLVVADDVAFNGRVGSDSILVAAAPLFAKIPGLARFAAGLNPLAAQSSDTLPSPYLIFVCDFDAQGVQGSGDAALDDYLVGLWSDMGEEWGYILQHCYGFHDVRDGAAFSTAIRRCQVETTMPFNDYWQVAPNLASLAMPLGGVVAPAVIGAVALIAGVLGWLIADHTTMWKWLTLIGLVAVVAGLYYAYRQILQNGLKPLPTAPDNDLPTVLKSLYVQQHFVRFAIDNQTTDPAALYSAFGQFLGDHLPAEIAGPTQPAGVVRSIPAATKELQS
jgi:hypothetical protein